ncbi:hypothetical protein [Sulfurimonas sp.]|uniref:hypothetical protein n=1 Tax=Sulfurimonas sp. TaxID=2022749 RepID=UPI0035680B45
MEEKEVTIEQLVALKEEAQQSINLGELLERLEKKKEFKEIYKLFVEDGKTLLWENIKAYKEADMLEKGTARVENIERFETEVQARLIFERFINRIKSDAAEAREAVKEIDQAIKEEQENE